jgi:hypothetical protein
MRVIVLAFAVIAAVLAVQSIPDLKRYLEITRM